MSGYFGALMRASGLVGPRAAPAVAPAAPPAITAPVVDTDGERAPAVRAHEPQPPLSETRLDALRAPDVVEPARPMVEASQRDDPAAPVVAQPADVRPAAETPAHVPVERARASDTPTRDVRERLVRAAMQWVAADPAVVRRPVTPAEIHIEQSAPVPGRHDAVSDTPPEHTFEQPIERPRSSAVVSAIQAPNDIESSAPIAAPPPAHALSLRPRTPVSPRPAVQLERDEVIEVSIGAIHVRLDAPATQTVARPAAAPPAQAPRAASAAPPRSALSRRALRRI